MLRVLVVDDDEKIRAFLRRGLTFEGFAVEEAADGEEGLRKATDQPPDLCILDIMMPGLDGLALCRQLRETGDTPILMLTARDEVGDKVRGLGAGADDYLPKPFAFEELLARMRALLRRAGRESGTALRFGDLVLDPNTREGRRGDRVIPLTVKEFDLLTLLLRNPRRVLDRDTIMARVWGHDYEGESNVLEVYVGSLRQKLEAGGEPRLIHTMRGIGYVLRDEQPGRGR